MIVNAPLVPCNKSPRLCPLITMGVHIQNKSDSHSQRNRTTNLEEKEGAITFILKLKSRSQDQKNGHPRRAKTESQIL